MPTLLTTVGLTAASFHQSREIVRALERRGLVPTFPEPISSRMRIFFHGSPLQRIAFVRANEWPWIPGSTGHEEFDFLLYESRGLVDSFAASIGHALGVRLRPQRSEDILRCQRFLPQLTGLSPNGKLLQHPGIRHACELVKDDAVRRLVSDSSPDVEKRAARQGLWLEWAALQSFLRTTTLAWSGVMAGQSAAASVDVKTARKCLEPRHFTPRQSSWQA